MDRPFVHGVRTNPAVHAERQLVPIEHRPLHAPVAAIDGDPGQVHQQPAAEPVAAPLRKHEEVFEVQAGPTEECREALEEEREADGFALRYSR